jgi:RimJ/RimL family protein N-acetyltransferase
VDDPRPEAAAADRRGGTLGGGRSASGALASAAAVKLVFGRDRKVADWVGDRLDIADFGPCTAIGVTRQGRIIAGLVYSAWRPPTIEITIASDDKHWATRRVIRAFMRYPFVQLKCKRLTAITAVRNDPARVTLERLGFIREGLHRDWFPDDDAISYGLSRAAAREWIE